MAESYVGLYRSICGRDKAADILQHEQHKNRLTNLYEMFCQDGAHTRYLIEGRHRYSQGVPQLLSNISVCQAITEAVHITLGTQGLANLIVDERQSNEWHKMQKWELGKLYVAFLRVQFSELEMESPANVYARTSYIKAGAHLKMFKTIWNPISSVQYLLFYIRSVSISKLS